MITIPDRRRHALPPVWERLLDTLSGTASARLERVYVGAVFRTIQPTAPKGDCR